jgi:hypothetical protein
MKNSSRQGNDQMLAQSLSVVEKKLSNDKTITVSLSHGQDNDPITVQSLSVLDKLMIQ